MRPDDYRAIYRAVKKTLRGKGDNVTAMEWRLEIEERSRALSESLNARTFEFGPYYAFYVTEPKRRLVLAINFAGKVAQHALCDEALYPAAANRLIADNAAVQKGKGTHFALDRLEKAMRHYFNSRKQRDYEARRALGLPPKPMAEWDYADGWVLKGDYSKFFYTLDHGRCKAVSREAMRRFIDDPGTLDLAEWLVDASVDSTEGPGLPIGNQSSQTIAILYLDELDHILRDRFGLAYGRYMDDWWVISDNKDELRLIREFVEWWSGGIGLTLNGKTQVIPLKNGIDYLGFHFYLTKTGKVVRKVKRKNITNRKRKIKQQRKAVDRGEMTLEQVVASYNSWLGHVSHGDTYKMRQKMNSYLRQYFPEIELKGEKGNGKTAICTPGGRARPIRDIRRQPDNLAGDRGES